MVIVDDWLFVMTATKHVWWCQYNCWFNNLFDDVRSDKIYFILVLKC